MKLTIVGCAGSFPTAQSPASCYLVEAEGFRLIMDLGNGSLGALQRYTSVYEVDAVLLSHLHADHCLDLTSYFVARNYRPSDCPELPERLPVYGPAGTHRRLADAYGMPDEPDLAAVFDFRTLQAGGELRLGPFTVTPDRVDHPVETYGFRVEHKHEGGSSSLVYSGDTAPCESLVRLAAGTDLLLSEASYQDGRDTQTGVHLNGRQAGEIAARAGAKRLVLTHIPAWTDAEQNEVDAKAAFAGPVELARCGAVYEV